MSDFNSKCTKIDFGWSFAPDPTGGAYSTPPDLLAVFMGPTSIGREGRERKREDSNGREGSVEFQHVFLSNLTTVMMNMLDAIISVMTLFVESR